MPKICGKTSKVVTQTSWKYQKEETKKQKQHLEQLLPRISSKLLMSDIKPQTQETQKIPSRKKMHTIPSILYPNYRKSKIKKKVLKEGISLAGAAQGNEHWPANRKVTGLIPRQGTYLGFRPGQLVDVFLEHQCFSSSFCLSLPISLKIN